MYLSTQYCCPALVHGGEIRTHASMHACACIACTQTHTVAAPKSGIPITNACTQRHPRVGYSTARYAVQKTDSACLTYFTQQLWVTLACNRRIIRPVGTRQGASYLVDVGEHQMTEVEGEADDVRVVVLEESDDLWQGSVGEQARQQPSAVTGHVTQAVGRL